MGFQIQEHCKCITGTEVVARSGNRSDGAITTDSLDFHQARCARNLNSCAPIAMQSSTMMTKPARIQLSRRLGFNLRAASNALNGLGCVKVDRSTKWGNPFVIGLHGTRAECVLWFECLLAGAVCLTRGPDPREQLEYLKMVRRDRHQLRGKNLACWCPLSENGKPVPCHADVLLRVKQDREDAA